MERGDTWQVDFFLFLYLWISSKSWSMPDISKPSWWESISLSWLWISFKHEMSNLVFLSVLFPPCFQETNRCGLWNLTSTWPSFLFLLSHIIFFLWLTGPWVWLGGLLEKCFCVSTWVYMCMFRFMCTHEFRGQRTISAVSLRPHPPGVFETLSPTGLELGQVWLASKPWTLFPSAGYLNLDLYARQVLC